MLYNHSSTSWKLDYEPNLLLKDELEGFQASWQRIGQALLGFIALESRGSSLTNQTIYQQSGGC